MAKDIRMIVKIKKVMPIVTVEEMEEYISEQTDLRYEELKRNTSIKKSVIKKGTMRGIKFDSKWEAAVYLYYNDIKGIPVERNTVVKVPYTAADGKVRNFYPDFIIAGRLVEVKGYFRENDALKMEQHPEIEFLTAAEIKPIIKELDIKLPNWKNDYLPRS